MQGVYTSPAKTFGAAELLGYGSFATNGTSSPTLAMRRMQRGLQFTVAYSATGIYTLTFDRKYKALKPCTIVGAWLNSALADYADVAVTANELHLPARRLVLQLHRAGVAQAPPANANGAFVNFEFVATNTNGK